MLTGREDIIKLKGRFLQLLVVNVPEKYFHETLYFK
jgi:hypothetical protein